MCLCQVLGPLPLEGWWNTRYSPLTTNSLMADSPTFDLDTDTKKQLANRLVRSLIQNLQTYKLTNLQTHFWIDMCPLRAANLPGSGHTAIACFQGFPLCQRHHPTEEDLPFAGWWLVRGFASNRHQPANGKGLWLLTLTQRVFLVLFIKIFTIGFVGVSIIVELAAGYTTDETWRFETDRCRRRPKRQLHFIDYSISLIYRTSL